MNLGQAGMIVLALLALPVAVAEEGLSEESVLWNRAVGDYRLGETSNALETARSLMATKSHGARAAELVARLEYDAAHDLSVSNSLEHLEAAAQAAQLALRSNPGDRRLRDNFARATEGLAELRETKRLEAVLAANEGKAPGEVLRTAKTGLRQALREAQRLSTATAAEQVELADRLEAEISPLADVWLPMREQVLKNETNETVRTEALAWLDETGGLVRDAARQFGDLEAEAGQSAAKAEDRVTMLYRQSAPVPELLQESIESQSNAWAGVESVGLRSWQSDAVGSIQAFRARFPQWADEYARQCQVDTNAPPLTAELRAKIEEAAAELEQKQLACCQDDDRAKKAEALSAARELQALMPVKTPPPQSPPPPKQQPPPQQSNQQPPPPQQQQDQQQDQQPDRQPEQQEQQQPEPQAQPEPEEKAQAGEPEPSKEEKSDAELLKRVLERSAEHRDEERKRLMSRPAAKDW